VLSFPGFGVPKCPKKLTFMGMRRSVVGDEVISGDVTTAAGRSFHLGATPGGEPGNRARSGDLNGYGEAAYCAPRAATACFGADLVGAVRGGAIQNRRLEAGERMGAGMESFDTGPILASSSKRLVIVADNSLIVEAIRIGFRKSGEFNLVGHADGRRTSPATIVGANPDVILLDDMDGSDRALELIRGIKAEDGEAAVIVLSLQMDPAWLERLFDAGATGVISKATRPVALATLVRETVNGHIFHRPPAATGLGGAQPIVAPDGDLPLTGREVEILKLVAAGFTNGDIARRLWVTEQTVKFHLRNVYRKLNVANRTQASHIAYVKGLVGARPEPPVVAPPELTVAS
jgi:DNA-binding NarL/FixJ family response regulator